MEGVGHGHPARPRPPCRPGSVRVAAGGGRNNGACAQRHQPPAGSSVAAAAIRGRQVREQDHRAGVERAAARARLRPVHRKVHPGPGRRARDMHRLPRRHSAAVRREFRLRRSALRAGHEPARTSPPQPLQQQGSGWPARVRAREAGREGSGGRGREGGLAPADDETVCGAGDQEAVGGHVETEDLREMARWRDGEICARYARDMREICAR